MKLFIAVLVAGLALIPVSDVSTQTFSFEKTGDIPLDLGDEITGQIGDLIQDADGRFYLTDFQQNTVWMCDANGKLIRRIGREGSGPGELNFPSGTTVYEDKVIVLDKGNSRVVVFKTDGTYVDNFRIDFFMATGILASKDGRIAVNSLWEPTLFTVFDMDGNIIGNRGERVADTKVFTALGDQHFSQTTEGHILYSSVKEYSVFRMKWDGTVLAEYEADSPGYGKLEIPSGVQFPRISDIMKTWTPILRPLAIGNHVLVQRKKEDFETGSKYFGDLFTMDGAPVQLAIELPYQFYAVDGDLLYGIDTTPVDDGADNPYIVVYRLREEDGR